MSNVECVIEIMSYCSVCWQYLVSLTAYTHLQFIYFFFARQMQFKYSTKTHKQCEFIQKHLVSHWQCNACRRYIQQQKTTSEYLFLLQLITVELSRTFHPISIYDAQ